MIRTCLIEFELYFPYIVSIKEHRKIMQAIISDIKKQNISVLEVLNKNIRSSTLYLSVVKENEVDIKRLYDYYVNFFLDRPDIRLISYNIEIY
ncbi:hypothetical protein TDSAC_0576 [Thermodesulfobium acidiphilum]|uniref:DUF503 domain-containing protein n=1 Tax=Thermodesulfobium acidiphilum TaxID=1794699 RepID=A0A2R4VZV0_THEAF|nr:DUF503 family protein [Thermodesulfobium acidiphilum]AWB09950.1 hypothetical protein TDSAC_0576 [Thermodesulfobium acidiphilum]PMP86963.1 MAG: hypothetical protein C0174_00035 [Thermodesulfobium narugense]